MLILAINYLLIILTLILPFIFLPDTLDPFEFPKAVFLIYVSISMFFLYGYGIITKNIQKIKLTGLHYLLFAYFIILIFSSLFGVDFNKSVWGQYYQYQGLITQSAFIIFFFIISQYKSLKINLNRLYKIFAYTGTFTAIIVVFQAISYYLFHYPVYTYNARMTAFLGNANFTAGFLSLSFIYLFHLAEKKWRFFFGFLFLAAIILTFSRGGLLAFLIGCFLLIKPANIKISYLAIIAAVFFTIMLLPIRPVSYFDNRIIIWTKGFTAFHSQIKPNEFDLFKIRVDKAHNEVLEVLVGSGIVGLVMWLTITGYALKNYGAIEKKKIFE